MCFNLEYERSYNTSDETTFWIWFHHNIAIFVMVSFLYFFVFTVLTFNINFEGLDGSQLPDSDKKKCKKRGLEFAFLDWKLIMRGAYFVVWLADSWNICFNPTPFLHNLNDSQR